MVKHWSLRLGMVGMALVGLALGVWADGTADKPSVQVYGCARLDMAYDSALTYIGDYAVYVKSENKDAKDNQLSITANQTRLGLNLSGPDFGGGKTTGKVEFDFYGGGTENKANVMMRHAYMELLWPDCGVSLLAGQTWDVFLPFLPEVLTYTGEAAAGLLGYRRPQLRLSKTCDLGGGSKLDVKIAAARSIGHTSSATDAKGFPDSGTDAGIPVGEAGVFYSVPLLTKQAAQIGISGHRSREEFDTNVNGKNIGIDSWSLVGSLLLPLMDNLTIKGAVWKGSNLDAYYGGILQGLNTAHEGINSRGAWFILGWKAMPGVLLNVGANADVPQASQLAAGDKLQNSAVYANAFYDLNTAVQVALEVSDLRTLYKNQTEGEAGRVQAALIYKF